MQLMNQPFETNPQNKTNRPDSPNKRFSIKIKIFFEFAVLFFKCKLIQSGDSSECTYTNVYYLFLYHVVFVLKILLSFANTKTVVKMRI